VYACLYFFRRRFGRFGSGRFGGLYFFRSSVCSRRFGRFGFCVVSGSVVSACKFFLLAVCIFFRSAVCIFSVSGLVVLVPVYGGLYFFRSSVCSRRFGRFGYRVCL
jgi:hypothetical protein